jgi:DNA repair protein RecN (Recombination protein N)
VRRVIGRDSRSRAWLNGRAVPVQLLREAGDFLIDIHGQHEFQSLTRSSAQRELLDSFGGHAALAADIATGHRRLSELQGRMLEVERRSQDREARADFLRYQVQELEALQLAAGEFAGLAEERTRLAHRGRLAEVGGSALTLLYEGEDGSAHSNASRALTALRGLVGVDARLQPLLPLVEGAAIQLREAARELQRYLDGLDLDTGRQEEVEQRLAAIEELARKHRVAPEELPGRAAALAAELETLDRAETDLAGLRREHAAALAAYRQSAEQLTRRRQEAAAALSREVTARMQGLGMTGGRFEARVDPSATGEPAPHGLDAVEFRVSANPGQPLRPLAKVASGGELSRLSLAVQVSCASRSPRCMVFDEVDSGIGGAVAEIVGSELRALADGGQVLCVTHLPQVASQGHQHLRVSKLTDGHTTRTALVELSGAERVEEVARMLGGVEVTARAREHASEMLERPGASRRRSPAPQRRRRPASA